MAELATIARPYAEALFGVAEAGDTAAWSTLVAELAQVAALPDVLSIATSPKVSHTQVVELLLAAVKSPLKDAPEAKNLVAHRRCARDGWRRSARYLGPRAARQHAGGVDRLSASITKRGRGGWHATELNIRSE